MASTLLALQGLIASIDSTIDELIGLDCSAIERKLTAKAFVAAAMERGTSDGVSRIEKVFTLQTNPAMQRAWVHPGGLAHLLKRENTSRPLKIIPSAMIGDVLDGELNRIGCTAYDLQAYFCKRLAKESPECFGLSSGVEESAAKLVELKAKRDRATAELIETFILAEEAVDKLGLRPQQHHRTASAA